MISNEGGQKKHLGKKNSKPISEKVVEGDEIKKRLTHLKKLMRATKKTSKKT